MPVSEINNMAFYTLVLGQLLNVFNLPEAHTSFIRNQVTRNPWVWRALIMCVLIVVLAYSIPLVREVLSLVPLSGYQMMLVAIFGLASLLITQLLKRIF